jgi:hypothetical protein
LSDSNDHAGFSFQISETPPPARARNQTPLADLVLDMGDFGRAQDPSPLPPRPAPAASAWVDPTISREPRAEAPAPPAARAPAPAPPAARAPAPAPAPASEKSEAKGAPLATAPKIKKITFPASKAPASKKPAETKKITPQTDERRTAKTRFSPSISAREPRPPLDSEPEVGEQETSGVEAPNLESHSAEPQRAEPQRAEPQRAEPQRAGPQRAEPQRAEPQRAGPQSGARPSLGRAEMAPPEDLPSADQEMPQSSGAATWHTDTPSAREVWQRARTSWRRASKQAVALGGQGLRAGKALAESASDKVRERLRQAADERSAQALLRSESEARPLTDVPHETAAPVLPKGSHPNKAGRLILGLARSAGRKAAAPASAVAAAALVYFVGSHLLGTDASVALSKTAHGPEVPDLGTLEEGREPQDKEKSAAKAPSRSDASESEEKAAPSGPLPMETEVAEMPKGMSWPGKGLIEVVTSQDELVYVDGVFTGRGPLRRIPVSPGEHEVSIRMDGKERKGSVQVVADKNTRAVFKGP